VENQTFITAGNYHSIGVEETGDTWDWINGLLIIDQRNGEYYLPVDMNMKLYPLDN
jgi:hypothetical protein